MYSGACRFLLTPVTNWLRLCNASRLDAGVAGGPLKKAISTRVKQLSKLKPVDATTPEPLKRSRLRQQGRVNNAFSEFATREIQQLGRQIEIVPSSIEKSKLALLASLRLKDWVIGFLSFVGRADQAAQDLNERSDPWVPNTSRSLTTSPAAAKVTLVFLPCRFFSLPLRGSVTRGT